jgi:hypothetical protein
MSFSKEEWDRFLEQHGDATIDIDNFEFTGNEDSERGTDKKDKDDSASETDVAAHKQGQKELSQMGGIQGDISGDDEFFWISAKYNVWGTENTDGRPKSKIIHDGTEYTVKKVDTQDGAVRRIHAQIDIQ